MFIGGRDLTSISILLQAKTTGYFLVVVPLIAFCIRCMIGAFHTRIAGGSGHQVANGSKGRHPGSKSVRWKSALRDIIEEDLDSGSRPRTNVSIQSTASVKCRNA